MVVKEGDGTVECKQLEWVRCRQNYSLGPDGERKRDIILEWSWRKQRSQGEASRWQVNHRAVGIPWGKGRKYNTCYWQEDKPPEGQWKRPESLRKAEVEGWAGDGWKSSRFACFILWARMMVKNGDEDTGPQGFMMGPSWGIGSSYPQEGNRHDWLELARLPTRSWWAWRLHGVPSCIGMLTWAPDWWEQYSLFELWDPTSKPFVQGEAQSIPPVLFLVKEDSLSQWTGSASQCLCATWITKYSQKSWGA